VPAPSPAADDDAARRSFLRVRTAALPSRRNELVGRAVPLEQVGALLDRHERLVTILGAAGLGKTRFALELGRTREATGHGLVAFVDLAHAQNVEDICAATAAALQIGLADLDGSSVALGRKLAGLGPALVILDNFEQIVELGPETVGHWLDVAADVSFVVTSRERLRLDGERVFELGPLAVSEADGVPSPAVELFMARMEAIRPGAAPSAAERRDVATLVERLEGVPLAIELAAARSARIGVAELASQLRGATATLASDRRDVQPRHRTLHAALSWSWDLLEPAERTALACASVFRGGFDRAGAEAVLAPGDRARTLDLLDSLRNKSLLQSGEADGQPGELRFTMYEYIREYAAGTLDAAQAAEAHARHAAHYATRALALADRVEHEARASRELARESANILAAHEHACATGDAERAIGAALGIHPLLLQRGPLERRRVVLDQALAARARSSAPVPTALLVNALLARCSSRMDGSNGGRLDQDIEEARAVLAKCSAEGKAEPALAAAVEVEAGYVLLRRGELAAGMKLLERALEMSERAGAKASTARALDYFARAKEHEGERDEAEAMLDRARSLYQELGLRHSTCDLLSRLCDFRRQLGKPDWEELADEAIAIAEEVESPRLWGHTQLTLACALIEARQLDAAARRLADGREALARAGYFTAETLALSLSGHVSLCRHEFADAAAKYHAAYLEFARVQHRRWEARSSAWYGAALAAGGQIEQAAEALEEAERHNETVGDTGLTALLQVFRAYLELGRARASRQPAAETAKRVRALTQKAPVLKLATMDEDIRLALTLLDELLGPEAASDDAWIVVEDGSGFRGPRQRFVALARRRALNRLLGALARKRVEEPGASLPHDDLVAIGWPDEQIAREPALNRLNFAIVSLRKLGLRDLLRTTPGGYLLDESVPLRVVRGVPDILAEESSTGVGRR